MPAGSKTAIRDSLLPATISRAAEIPFYRDLWSGLDPAAVTTTADLAGLPVIGRFEPAGGLAAVAHPRLTPDLLLHSGGTTGEPFVRYRSAAEVAACRRLNTGLRDRVRARRNRQRPLVHVSSVAGTYHGNVIGALACDRSVTVPHWREGNLARTVRLLGSGGILADLDDPVIQLSGPPDDLAILADALTQAGIADTLPVRRVVSIGSHLGRPRRDQLAHTLPHARVIDRYSLSEAIGGATSCDRCAAFHFDAHIVPEVVALIDDHRLDSGVGRLVLTELYPFSQYQPMVRYDTGDLAEIVRSPCEPGEISVTLVGRATDAALAPSVYVRPIPLRDALEAMPLVARAVLPGQDRVFGSAPLADVRLDRSDPSCVRLTVVAVFAPHLYPDEAHALRCEVERAVLVSCPELRELIRRQATALSVTITGDRRAATAYAAR